MSDAPGAADRLTPVPCALCRGTETTLVCEKFGLPIARCTTCGLVRATPRCAPERIAARYSAEYFWGEYLPSLGVVNGQVDERFIDERYAPWVQLGASAGGPAGRLLEIGSGAGLFAKAFARAGWTVTGVEINPEGAQFARERLGVDVRSQYAEDLDVAPGTMDVVAMMDVIEHVPEPRHLLATAYRLLRTGGRLIVYTPNHRGAVVVLAKVLHAIGAGVAVREIFGGNHVCFFDDRSLPAALEREGFSVNAVRLFPYDPSRPGGPVSPISLAAVTAVEWLGWPFQRTFRMLALATKVA